MSTPKLSGGGWYRQTKKADASSSEDTGTVYLEGEPREQQFDEISFGPHPAYAPFNKGDKVRLRAGGIPFGQTEGRVTEAGPDQLTVEWETGRYKGKISQFDIYDTVRLHSTLEKVQ